MLKPKYAVHFLRLLFIMKGKDSSLLQVPNIAWPTVLVFIIAAGLWATFFYLGYRQLVSLPIALFVMGPCVYLLFTPMHDSTHKAVFRQKGLNDWIGRLCGIPLMAPFVAFRFCHLEHHKYTNDTRRDPDMWSGGGSNLFSRFLHWLTQDFFYYSYFLPKLGSRPIKERFEAVLGILLNVFMVSVPIILGDWRLLALILIPPRFAITLLAFAFDFLPHRPHKITSEENRYLATSNFVEEWTSPLLMYQNYHLSHHLFPSVPFYRYKAVWKSREEELLQKGCKIRSIFSNEIVREFADTNRGKKGVNHYAAV